MNKFWTKTIVISVMVAYIFTISFGFLFNSTEEEKLNNNIVEVTYEAAKEQSLTNFEDIAATINKFYNTVVGVSKIIKN